MAAIIAISGFQNLPNLNYLRLDGPNNGCETIDVSGCTSLTYLDVSDMDIPDTDTPSLKYLNVEGCTALVNLYMDDSDFSEGFPDLSSATALQYFDADQCGITESLDLTAFTELRGFDLNYNEGLTSVTISSSSQSLGYERSLYLDGCALTQTAVDNMLVALSEGTVENGYVDLSSGNNAAPGTLGLAAKATLELSGWTVSVNIE